MRGYAFEVLSSEPVRYKCRCSGERVERTLVALGEGELREMVEANHGAEVKCEFCGERYTFSELELTSLVSRAQAPN